MKIYSMQNLDRASQLFRKILIVNASVLFSMSIQRLVLFLVVVRHWLFGANGFEIASSFFAGIRFDLCVLGFLNIPLLLLTWAVSTDRLAFLQKWVLWIYLAVISFVIHLFGYFDLVFFAGNGRRWTQYDLQDTGFHFLSEMGAKWSVPFMAGVVLLFIMLWVFRSLMTMYRVGLYKVITEPSRFANSKGALVVLGIILPFLVVAFSARGTWTPHHINIEHAQVSQNQALNQLALSPIWAFDKKF